MNCQVSGRSQTFFGNDQIDVYGGSVEGGREEYSLVADQDELDKLAMMTGS